MKSTTKATKQGSAAEKGELTFEIDAPEKGLVSVTFIGEHGTEAHFWLEREALLQLANAMLDRGPLN